MGDSGKPLKVAIAHDYLTQRGGAERVVLAMARAFPGATIYTTLYDPSETFPGYAELDIRTSWLNRIGFFRKHHRAALPLLPFAAGSLKIDADVVLVSSSGWAHGIQTTGKKVVYCYAPARWLHQSGRYLGDHSGLWQTVILFLMRPFLLAWDKRAARSAAAYLTISSLVQDRVHVAYGLPSTVVPAPWPDTRAHQSAPMAEVIDWLGDSGFELCVSRLLPYKNVRSVVAAYAEEPGRRLIVVGRGPEEAALRQLATDNVLFLQNISDEQLAWLYRSCTALIAISFEDFGLTPLEAASFGKPSIVLRWGGFLETQIEGVTATFVDEPTPQAVREGLQAFDGQSWDADAIRAHADEFNEEVFVRNIRAQVARIGALAGPSSDPASGTEPEGS